MGQLRLDVSDGALRTEHERLLRTALRRGDKDPEGALADGALEGEYNDHELRIARTTWLRRMVHEHHSAAVFSRLLPQLMAAGATLDVKSTTLRASMDELRHASLCAGVVQLLGAKPVAETDLTTEALPAHEDATAVEVALRNMIFASCMCETISVSLLTEERELTTEPVIHRVVDQLAADEVLHAKLGWAYLGAVWPGLDAEQRARTDAYLPVAFGSLEANMLTAMPLGKRLPDARPDALHALGVLDSEAGRELLYATIEEIIVPRLGDAGLDARSGWSGRKVAVPAKG